MLTLAFPKDRSGYRMENGFKRHRVDMGGQCVIACSPAEGAVAETRWHGMESYKVVELTRFDWMGKREESRMTPGGLAQPAVSSETEKRRAG